MFDRARVRLTPGERIALKVIFAFLLLPVGGGGAVVGWGISSAVRAARSATWPATDGTIVSAEIVRESHPGSGAGRNRNPPTTTHRAKVAYRYAVDGSEFRGERIAVTESSSSDRSIAKARLDRYSAGTSVRVYYDPDNPADAILEPGASYDHLRLLLVGAALAVVPLALLVPVWRRIRGSAPGRRPAPLTTSAKPAVRVLSESPAQLVLHIPAGSEGVSAAGWIGAVALGLGLFFAVMFGPQFAAALARGHMRDIVLVVGFAVVMVIGLACLVWWAKLKYTSYVLRLESDSILIERKLFGLTRQAIAQLPAGAYAELVVDHHENNEPILAVTFSGAAEPLRFATSLALEEKLRLVQRINAFLGVQPHPEKSPEIVSG